MTPALILASRSPQRRAILEQAGVPFTVRPAGVDELETGPPEEVALENAYRKAARIAADAGPADGPVLGVDTVVSLGSQIYGQPTDPADAARILGALSGRPHRVISGLCVIEGGRVQTAAARTVVRFAPLDAARIDWYVARGEWRGRAGGYAIQGAGAVLVEAIDGDYLNVVGLPLRTLLELRPGLLGDRSGDRG
ncbi:MAG TPA: nucleoside triphosphate pyrophosphatase [Solirubrobacteraceae bacterium]|nr:nucleoside triphosphate pyrophosphatase [Solirubrobacteraceae bacterium]